LVVKNIRFVCVYNFLAEKLIEHEFADAIRAVCVTDNFTFFLLNTDCTILISGGISILDDINQSIGLIPVFVNTRLSVLIKNEPHHAGQKQVAQTTNTRPRGVCIQFLNRFHRNIKYKD
jgi:hypothetical protein